MKKKIFSFMAALVVLISSVLFAFPVSAEDEEVEMTFQGTYNRDRQWNPYTFTETDIAMQLTTAQVQGLSSDNGKRTFEDFASDEKDVKHVTFYGYPSENAIYDDTARDYYRNLVITTFYYSSDTEDVYYNFSSNTNSIYYDASCSSFLGYQEITFCMNQFNYELVKIKSSYFYDAADDSSFSFRNAHRYDIIGMSDDLSVWGDSNFTDLIARGVNYGYDVQSPFTVTYPENFGLNMSREITITGKQGFSWSDVNNQISLSIELSDSFLNKSGKYDDINDMTYGVVVTIGTESITGADNISDFLCDSSKTIFTAYNSGGYYYEGSSLDVLSLINEQYSNSDNEDDRGFGVGSSRGFDSHTGKQRGHTTDELSKNNALTFKRCSGFTPIFTLDRSKPTSLSIDLSTVYGLTEGKQYYINIVGVAANSPKYYLKLLSPFYTADGDTDLGAYPYHDDFLYLNNSITDEWIVNFNSSSDYQTEEFYYSYAVSSVPFSYEDYPAYNPVTTTYVDDNGFTQTVELGRSFEDTMNLPPTFATDRRVLQSVGGSGDVPVEDFDKIKEEESLNETVETFKFDVPFISSIFDGTSNFFKFLTYCINLLPSSYLSVLLTFFGIFLAIVLIKFVF